MMFPIIPVIEFNIGFTIFAISTSLSLSVIVWLTFIPVSSFICATRESMFPW